MEERGQILIADDEDTFLRSTSRLLEKEGYHCDCARDAKEAAEALTARDYDVLVTDIKMPGNMELEFLRDCNDRYAAMPIVIVTGYPSVQTAIESLRHSVVDYMIKPLDFEEFLKSVELAAEKGRLWRAVNQKRKELDVLALKLKSVESALKIPGRNKFGGLTADICDVFDCPRTAAYEETIQDAIEVLIKTKGSFKSRDLADLRKRLEAAIGSRN